MGTTVLMEYGMPLSSDKKPSIMNSLWTKYQQTEDVNNRPGKACNPKN